MSDLEPLMTEKDLKGFIDPILNHFFRNDKVKQITDQESFRRYTAECFSSLPSMLLSIIMSFAKTALSSTETDEKKLNLFAGTVIDSFILMASTHIDYTYRNESNLNFN
jgi:hypothetical protein